MAASPPPYPPPTPHEQRRQWKDYARAQRDAARNQRSYWRAMHRPSIAGPILLIAVGVVALLIETGHLSSAYFWDWFVRWWPMLLIGLGAISLLEWFFDRDQPYRRQRGGAGIVILVLILVGIAYSREHLRGIASQFGQGNDNWGSFLGQEHDHDAESSIPIPAKAAVQVENPHGDVTITASGNDQLNVHAHQIVNTNSDNDARRSFQSLEPKVTVNGSSVLVRVEGANTGRADLTIELPVGVSTDITAAHGDVTMEGLKGTANVNAGHGNVKLTGMGGNVHVHMGKGDLAAHGIGGDVAVDGHVDDLTLSEIKGGLLLNGDFFGDTHLEQIGSKIHFHSSRTDLDVSRLAGDLTMDSGDLHVGQAVGPLRIVTRSKDIECSQVSGDVHIENSNGEVLVTAVQPLGNILITNASDPITLTLPGNANFSINAAANGGDLNTDFPLNVTGDDEHRTATGQVGTGGVKIELTAHHGDISVKKGGNLVMPPVPPVPPMPPMPAMPKGPVKHLRVPPDSSAPKAEPGVL